MTRTPLGDKRRAQQAPRNRIKKPKGSQPAPSGGPVGGGSMEFPPPPQEAAPDPSAEPEVKLPEVGDVIEYRVGGSSNPQIFRDKVIGLHKDPITQQMVPIIETISGNERPVMEWYDTGAKIVGKAGEVETGLVGGPCFSGSPKPTAGPNAPLPQEAAPDPSAEPEVDENSMDPVKFKEVITRLRSSDPAERSKAAREAGDLGYVEPLIEALQDPDKKVRFWAAYSLGAIKDPRAVDPLINSLKDVDEGVRYRAVEALGEIADSKAKDAIEGALKDPSAAVCQIAAWSLKKIEQQEAQKNSSAAGEPDAVSDPKGVSATGDVPEVDAPSGYVYSPGDEFLSREQLAAQREGDKKAPEIREARRKEKEKQRANEEEFEGKMIQFKEDMAGKARNFARKDLENTNRWEKFKKILGIGREAEKDEVVKNAEKEFDDALWAYVEAGKEKLPEGNKELARVFLKYAFLVGEIDLRSIKVDEAAEMKRESGAWSNKYTEHYKKSKDWWKNLSFKKKMAYSGAVFAVGATGIGASFASIGAMTLSAKMGTRILGAGVMYDSSMKWQEALDVDEAEYMVNQKINEILKESDWEERIKKLTKEEVLSVAKERRKTFESYDSLNKRRAYLMALALPVVTTAVDIYRWGFKTAGAGRLVGESVTKPSIQGIDTSPGSPSSGGVLTNADTSPKAAGEIAPRIQGQEMNNIDASSQNSLENTPKSVSGILTETDSSPKAVEIGSDTVGRGGGLWRSTERFIRANPEEFKLDRKSANFVGEVRKLTRELLENHASEHGMSYEELNEIASTKVQSEDILKFIKDPSTGEIHVEYSRDDIFGQGGIAKPDVPLDEGADKEKYIQEKAAKINEEYLKYKGGGISAEQHAAPGVSGASAEDLGRSRPAPKAPEWLQKHNDNIAMKKAVEGQFSDVQKGTEARLREIQGLHHENITAEAVIRQGIAVRGLLKNIIHESGIGNNVSLWDEPAEKWYGDFINSEELIPQDVSQNMPSGNSIDNINNNRRILKKIFSQLPKPQPGQKTWPALLDALRKDPGNLVRIEEALNARYK